MIDLFLIVICLVQVRKFKTRQSLDSECCLLHSEFYGYSYFKLVGFRKHEDSRRYGLYGVGSVGNSMNNVPTYMGSTILYYC